MNEVNALTLAEISHKSPTAEEFFTYAACRERHVRGGISSVDSLRDQMRQEGFLPVPKDLVSLLKDLEKVGVGQFKGKFFRWNTSIRSVGEMAHDSSKVIPIKKDVKVPAPKTKTLVMCLPGGKEVSITFSTSLTSEEVTFLSEKILKECE